MGREWDRAAGPSPGFLSHLPAYFLTGAANSPVAELDSVSKV